jgi:PKD domain
MNRPFRIAKRLTLPTLLAIALVVATQVVLAAPPVPSFTAEGPGGSTTCGLWTFTSTSTDPDGDIATTTWDIDGTPASGPTASANFATTGARIINMSVTDGTAGDGDAGAETLAAAPQTVTVTNTAPTASIDVPDNVQSGVPAQFTATGSDDGTGLSYAWDFDGDGFDDGTGATVNHTFSAGGAQTARVQVTDSCGVTGIGQAQVTVVAQAPPVASFTIQVNNVDVDTVNSGVQVTFTSTSTDPNNDALTYSWSLDGETPPAGFDDGTTQTVTKTYPTFSTAKNIVVRLNVSDGVNPPVQATALLRINKAPFAAFTTTPAGSPLINEAVGFDASSSFDFDTAIASYEWDWDYGGTAASFTPSATGVTASHAFATSGPKPVALRVTDTDGGVTIAPRTLEVELSRPTAGLRFSPANPLPGQQVTLTSTSAPSVSASHPVIVATQWDLAYAAIGNFSIDRSGPSTVTSFATPGPHTVAVKATETGGGFAIAQATIPVNAPPAAGFNVSTDKPIEGKKVTFTSTSSDPDGPLVKQEWDLNNDGKYERSGGVVSTTKLKKGKPTIRLRVTDSKGATAVASQKIKVDLRDPVEVRRRIFFARREWGVLLVRLEVKVPSKTTVKVSCKGSGCPRGSFVKRSGKKGATLRFTKLHGSLRAGAKVVVLTTRTGYVSGYDTYVVRRGFRPPLLKERCKVSVNGKPIRCP